METTSQTFTNWSGQYASLPAIYAVPETVQEIQEIVKNKEKFPSPLVAIGSGHSNSGCTMMNGGTAMDMKKFRQISKPGSDEITAGAGLTLLYLHRHLAEIHLQLPFTPEIGNATLGSVACCCLKDAAIGQSSGIGSGMIKAIKYIDSLGSNCTMKRGAAGWEAMLSGHGLFGIIYEVTLDIIPMKSVILDYKHTHIRNKNFIQEYHSTLQKNDGIFGLLNASSGKIIFETRNLDTSDKTPSKTEHRFNKLDQQIFRYFNPVMGAMENNLWSGLVRFATITGFSILKILFPNGRRAYKNLKPIDYSENYPYRWDFHFWAYPVVTFPDVVLPAFIKFLKAYKKSHPGFDEKGLMACYRIRVEKSALLSPSFEEERMTLDPVRPFSRHKNQMEIWDQFCMAYNDFAISHGGTCTFNQTKNLSRNQAEKAFGARWIQFKKAREKTDPNDRFLSEYFRQLMYG